MQRFPHAHHQTEKAGPWSVGPELRPGEFVLQAHVPWNKINSHYNKSFFPHDNESLIKRSKYLFWRSWCTADFISFTITESSGAGCISSRSLALRGAMIDRVGVLSWDITKVAFFSGFRACATSSAAVMSASVRVHRSFSYFRTSGASSAAETAGCCSKNLSSMSKALFQRVGTSVTSLCCGRTSNFCLFLSAWLAKVLWWKKWRCASLCRGAVWPQGF